MELKKENGAYSLRHGSVSIALDNSDVDELIAIGADLALKRTLKTYLEKREEGSRAHSLRNDPVFFAKVQEATEAVLNDEKIYQRTIDAVTTEYIPQEGIVACPKCGCRSFYGHQVCYHDVIAGIGDGGTFFEDDVSIGEAERIYGPYTCAGCGYEMEEE